MAMTGFLVRKAATAALRSSTGPKKRPEKRKRSRLPPGRALLLGAGLMTAGRWLVRGRGGHITETVQQWMDEVVEELEGDGQPDEEEYTEEDEEHEDEELDEGQPEDEADEDFEDEPETDAQALSDEEDEEEVPTESG
jgi:hypothetical protein